MTTTTKPVKRETLSSVRQSGGKFKWYPLVIELHGTFLRIRPKGKRFFYTVTYDQVFTLGAHNQAAANKIERAAKRKAKRLQS